MARKIDSNPIRKRKARLDKEAQILAAVEAYRLEQIKPPHLRKGVNRLAAEMGVNGKTVLNRYNGMRSILEANSAKQLLPPEQEECLVDLIMKSSDHGQPVTKRDIRHYATTILDKTTDGHIELGKRWEHNFLVRHSDKIQTYRSKHLDSLRAQCVNAASVDSWFDMVEEHLVANNVKPKNVFGMDESGFRRSNLAAQVVVGRKGKKNQYRVGTANKENVTVLVTICADGSCLPPSIIYKGNNLYKRWTNENVANARYVSL